MATISDTRRKLLRGLAAGCAALPLLRSLGAFAAAALPHLSPDDPAAKALGYTENSSGLNAGKEPLYKPGNTCASCVQYQAREAAGGYAPCTIFPGKSVNAKGWCRVFAARP